MSKHKTSTLGEPVKQHQSTTRKNQPLSSHPQAGLTRGEGGQLSKGFDQLKFGLYVQFDSMRFFDILTDAKEEAQDLRSQIPIRLGPDNNYDYNCHSNGRKGGYNFHLSRADVDIFISTRKDWMLTPNVWVDIGSASCWSPGYNEVIHFVSKLLNLWDGKIIKNSVSEVHLCTDFIGIDVNDLPIQHRNRWVSRANRLHTFSDVNRLSGITLSQTEGTLRYLDENDKEIETGIRLREGDIILINLRQGPGDQTQRHETIIIPFEMADKKNETGRHTFMLQTRPEMTLPTLFINYE